jgi:4-diphosphocytidyl-2-C-methyl-D-erythritol kinase
MIVFPHAKINIGLFITGKRSDGFHDLETLFAPVYGLKDILELVPGGESGVRLNSTGLSIPGKEKLVTGAAEIMLEKSRYAGIDIHLHKMIPMGGGLGGGSSDAAMALQALNVLLELDLEEKELADIALDLGSDCPFFLKDAWQIGHGRGEILRDFPMPEKPIYALLVNPEVHISTAEAFSSIKPKAAPINWEEEMRRDFYSGLKLLRNDFEPYAFNRFPILDQIKREMMECGAFFAQMSGSGSTMFGLFHEKPDLNRFSFSEMVISLTLLNEPRPPLF